MKEEQDPVEEILNHWVRAIGQQVHYSYFAPPPETPLQVHVDWGLSSLPLFGRVFSVLYILLTGLDGWPGELH